MKHKFIFLSLACNIVLAIVLGAIYFTHQIGASLLEKFPVNRVAPASERSAVKKYPVAIILPTSHKAFDSIIRGFEETLINKYKLNVSISIFNANGSRSLLRAQVEEVAQWAYAAAIPIGAVATQLTKEVFMKKKISMPIVFAAVADPEALGIIDATKKERRIVTGSTATTNYPLQIELLFMLKPSIKNVLLVYDPSQPSGRDVYIKQIKHEFAQRGVELKIIEVFNVHEIQQKIPLVIDKDIDLVMILKDNTVVPAVDMLITQCERYGITLFVGDLDSVKKGAVLGFGVREYSFGVDAAKCAYKVLHDGLQPEQVPVRMTDAFRFAINQASLGKQGVSLSDQQYKLLKSVEFVGE